MIASEVCSYLSSDEDCYEACCRIEVRVPSEDEVTKTTTRLIAEADTDGDLSPPRNSDLCRNLAWNIQLQRDTNLDNVGLQLWGGALLMTDFIVDCESPLRSPNVVRVLELGCGVGLCGCALTRLSNLKRIVLTDVETCLPTARANLHRNTALDERVTITKLDWRDKGDRNSIRSQSFDAVICADCVYDEDLTDALLECLLLAGTALMYVAVERRTVFTVEQLKAHAPALDYFLSKAAETGFRVEQLPTANIASSLLIDYSRDDLLLFQLINNDGSSFSRGGAVIN
jgi:predicted nicotinamide N-methyase